jgi:two-component sensor histidine kinase
VVVGDVALDEDVRALVAAIREALTNAGKHADVATASVYVEVEQDQVTAFVRDRGNGFDPDVVATDRRGLRGLDPWTPAPPRRIGEAVHRPGEGTEWELVACRCDATRHQRHHLAPPRRRDTPADGERSQRGDHL